MRALLGRTDLRQRVEQTTEEGDQLEPAEKEMEA